MNDSSLSDRIFAAFFSGAAAGITYTLWLFFNSSVWGDIQIESLKEIGIWIVLAGALLGFFGGLNFVTALWSGVWETSNQPILSLRTAIYLILFCSIAYGAYKLFFS